MTDVIIRNQTVKAARRKFANVYINPDWTVAQRRQDKILREELKKKNDPLNLKENWATATHYHIIRNDTVVRINK